MRSNLRVAGWEVGLEPKARWHIPGKVHSHSVVTMFWVSSFRQPLWGAREGASGHCLLGDLVLAQ